MGIPASKFGQEIEQEEPTKGSLPSTPILTPKSYKLSDLDPRSPSENIVRTPIDVLLAKNSNSLLIERKEEITPPVNEGATKNIFSPTVKLKSIDPRSPTVDFIRTPIIVPEDDAPLPLKLHNKNLDNVRKTLLNSPLTKSTKRLSDKISTPKLLESNVISPKPIETKRKSYVGLLETNLDFVETDLDSIKVQLKAEINEDENVENETGQTPEEFSTPLQDMKSFCYKGDIYLNDLSDPRSPSIQFIRTPIPILQKLEELDIKDDDPLKLDCNDNDDGLEIIPEKLNECQSNLDIQNKTETIKDFDKKLSNLIYEDQKIEVTFKSKKVTDAKSRTPLGNRNTNTNLNKGISKLKVHDKPRKNLRDFSKIPIFQNRKSKCRFNQQCENTPPNSLSDKKLEKQQWDPDNTVII